MTLKFGVAGNPDRFYEQGYKASLDMPKYLQAEGLDAYEYQLSRGVRISQALAESLGERAREYGIALSVHAPYYISLSSSDPEIVKKTQGHFLKTAQAATWMGAKRVIFHPGSVMGGVREESMARTEAALGVVLELLQKEGFGHLLLCPETMGKVNQLGTVDEVIGLCKLGPNLIPCIDFGHLNARDMGSLNSQTAMAAVLTELQAGLGPEKTDQLHIHFSPIEYSKGGEKRHLNVKDGAYEPDFALLAPSLAKQVTNGTVICESAGDQDLDALYYRSLWLQENK